MYFTYDAGGFRRDSGYYSIPLRYPFLARTYGVKKKYSKLNKNEAKSYLTIEVDTKKIYIKNDISYNELLSDRNRLYKKRAIKNAVIFFLFIAIVIILKCII